MSDKTLVRNPTGGTRFKIRNRTVSMLASEPLPYSQKLYVYQVFQETNITFLERQSFLVR